VGVAAAAITLAGCGLESGMPACTAGIPAQAELLRDPAFAALKYHKRTPFDISRGAGFDLWADSKFEFKSGVEFSIVPSPNEAAGARYCTDAVTVTLALPLDDSRREMLRAFVRTAPQATALRGKDLQARIDEMLASGAKYRALAAAGGVSAQAGAVSHPNRGDLFVVAFIWQ
jgi:hypothetical protein